MPEDRQKLTPKSLEEFVSKVHSDPQLKKEILRKLSDPENAVAVVNEFFVLDPKQSENLNLGLKSPEMKQLLSSALSVALTTGGRVRLTRPDLNLIEPQNAGVHVGVHTGPNGTDIDVSITCPV